MTSPLESFPIGPPAPEPAAAEPASAPPPPVDIAVWILAFVAVVAALYLARAFFVPLLIGIFTSYALRPLVDRLKAWHVPRAAGAALALIGLVAGLSWATLSLRDDAASVIEKLPESARKVRRHISAARSDGPTALQNFQEAAAELQGAATDASGPQKRTMRTVASPSTAWLGEHLLAQSALLFTVVAQAPIVLLLAYFLLASGSHFRRKLVQLVGPSLSRKKEAVGILEEIDSQVQRYLLTVLGTNALVVLGTWLAFEALGMEQAGVWGVAAGVLHFIPYLGPLVFALACGTAGFLQFGTVLQALAVAGASLLVAMVVGSLIMTWMQSRSLRVNAAVLFIALLFFAWLWGICGLLLGAPLVAIAKVICDRVEPLKPVGELLGR